MKTCTTSSSLLCLAAAIFAFPYNVWPATQTYDAANGANVWDTTTSNWDGSTVPWANGNDAVFGGTGEAVAISPVTVQNLTINSTGYSFSGGLLTFAGTTPTVTAAQDVTLASTVTGSAGLIKTGAGVLTVSESGSITGGITVNQGTLRMNQSGHPFNTATGWNGGAVTVNAGGTVVLASDFNAGYARAFTINGGTLNATAGAAADSNNYLNNLTLQNGASVTGNALRMGFHSNATVTVGGSSASTISGRLLLVNGGGNSATFNVADATSSSANDLTVSGIISDYSGLGGTPVIKSGVGTLLLSGANSYSGNTTVSAGTLELGGAGQLGGGAYAGAVGITGNLVVNTSSAQTLSGLISGAGTLTKSNTGTLILSGANTGFSGGTTLTAGVLSADHDSALGTGALTLSGGTLRSTSGNRILANNLVATASTTSALLDNTGSGDMVLTGTVTGSGALTVNSTQSRSFWLQGNGAGFTGTINYTNNNGGTSFRLGGTGVGGNSLTNGSDWSGTTFALSGSGTNNRGILWNGLAGTTVKLGALSGTGRIGMTGNAAVWEIGALNTTTTFSGVIDGTNAGVLKVGTGTLTLSGVNAYTGNTTVNAGILKLGNKNALGAFLAGQPVTQVTVVSGAAVDFNGVLDAVYGYTIAGTGVGGTGALVNTGSGIGIGIAQTSNILLSAAATVGGTGNWALLTGGYGATSLNLSNFTMTKAGSNTLTLVNTTTTAGTVSVTAGTLELGVTGNSGTAVNGSASALTLSNTAGAGLLVQVSSSVGSIAGGGASGGTVSLASGTTLTAGALGTSTSYAGVISGAGAFTKAGTGTLTLSGSNTYTGTTTVNAGTLKLGNMNALGAFQGGRPVTQVLVNSGGAIDLNGVGDAVYGYTIAGTGVGGTGALLNTGSGISNFSAQTSNIKLSANATIGGTGNWSLLTNGYGATTLDLNGQTLTKTGSNQVYLVNSTVTAGTVSISGGNFTFGISENAAGVNASAASFVVNSGGTFRVYRSSTIGGITLNGGTLNTAQNLTTNITLNNTANTIAPDGAYWVLSGQLTGAGGFTVANGGGTPGVALSNPANNFAGNVTVNGATYLRLDAGEVLPNTASVTVNGHLRMDAAGGGTETIAGLSGSGEVWVPTSNNTMQTLTVGAGNTTSSFSGTIGVSGQNNAYLRLVKTGSGTLTLNGNNQYLGGTTVNGGTLQLNAGAWGTGIIRGTATVNNGATLELGVGGGNTNPMTWTDTVNINGGGTLTVSTGGAAAYDVAQYFGTLNLDSSNGNAALVTAAANTGLRFRAQAGSVINSAGPVPNTISSNLWLVNTGSPSTSALNVAAGNTLIISGNLADYPTLTNTTLIKNSAGSLTLSGNNTYAGTTLINNGVVNAQGGGAIGDLSTVNIADLATAQLQISHSEQVGALHGGGTSGGNITLGTGTQLTIGNNSTDTSYGGVISGVGASLLKRGSGNQTLTGNNTFTGGVTIQNGIVTVPFVAASGTPQPLGTAGSAVTFTGAGSLVVTGSGTMDRGLVLENAANGLSVGGTVTQTGTIAGGGSSATFTKSGLGTFNQSGAGSWNSNVSITAGTYNVTSGGSIAGVGAVGISGGSTMNIDTATQVRASGFNVSAGTLNLNAGTLRTNGITVAGGSAFTWGAATLTMQNAGSGNSGSTDRTGNDGVGGAASGPTIYEGTVITIDNGIGNTVATSNGSVLDLGTMYGGSLLRYDQLRVTGTLNLSANDTLRVAINPYLLRPSSPNDVATGDWGTLVLVYADTITEKFDTVTGITSDGIGWTQLATETDSGRLPSSLNVNEWVLEYRTGYGPLSGGDALLLHYRVAGSVPEPASAGLLVAGALLLRALGRRKA